MLEHQYVVSSFLHKLWSMLEDPSNAPIISWNDDGTSFIVHDPARFAIEVLPKFYKHNNMASFIRQLNMYGFSKISHDPSHNALYSVKHAESTAVEFQHPNFLRGQPDLVATIKRKTTSGGHESPGQQLTTPYPSQGLKNDPMALRVLSEVQQLHKKHDSFSNQLEQLQHENEVLWREMASLRQKCQSQQTVISKVVNFLVSVIGNGTSSLGGVSVGNGGKRPLPMLEPGNLESNGSEPSAKMSKLFGFSKASPGGPTIQEIIEDDNSPVSSAATSMKNVVSSSEAYLKEDSSQSDFPEPTLPLESLEPPVKVVPLPSAGPQIESTTPSRKTPPPSTSAKPTPAYPSFHSPEDINNHFDTMQFDLDQLRNNLRSYFATTSPETETHQFNDDFLSDLFNAEQPLPELASPLSSPMLATPLTTPCEEDSNGQPKTQMVKFLPSNPHLVSGSQDPLLYTQQPVTINPDNNSKNSDNKNEH